MRSLPVAVMTMACHDSPSELEEVPEMVADECERIRQERGGRRAYQPGAAAEEAVEAAGNARLTGSRGELRLFNIQGNMFHT